MTCTAAIQELLEMARMPGGSDRALVAMLDLSERDPAALSTLLILAMKARVERSGMLRAAAELLPDNSATEVCRFAWSEFKSGNSHWLAAEIAAQAAYRVPGLLHDDWDAVLRLSAHEPVEGPFWRELPIEVGRRWIQEARGASSSVAGLLGLPLEMSGVVEFQDAVCDLSGSRDEPWATIGREGLSGLEVGSGRALHGARGLHLRFTAQLQRLQLAESTSVEGRLQRLHPTWKGGAAKAVAHMGGRLEGQCGICGSPLQRLLELELALIGPCTLSMVTLGICLDCPDNGESGWCHGDPVYFRPMRRAFPTPMKRRCSIRGHVPKRRLRYWGRTSIWSSFRVGSGNRRVMWMAGRTTAGWVDCHPGSKAASIWPVPIVAARCSLSCSLIPAFLWTMGL